MAAGNLLLLPILYFVKDRPDTHDEAAHSAGGSAAGGNAAVGTGLQTKELMLRADFWLLILGFGLLNGSGMIKISHLVALTAEQGVTLADAGLLLAVSGGAGAVGSLFFGWLADKIGGIPALCVNALVQAGTWSIFLMKPSMTLMMVDAIIMGVAGAGVYAAGIVAKNDVFGAANLAKVMGVSGPFIVIPNFMSPAVAGMIRDATGGYEAVLMATIASCLVSCLCLLTIFGQLRGKSRQQLTFA
jgi:cyanate permease